MNQSETALYEQRRKSYLVKGIAFAMASGVCYGLYTGFLTLAQTQGVWGDWFAGAAWGEGHAALSAFTVTFVLAALAAGINDLFSGIWSVVVCAKNRQIGDLLKTARTKPGAIMMLCAAVGGPFATIAYVVALNAAASSGNPGVIVPIAALNCAIGALLSRVLFKQKLEAHKIAGIVICMLAGTLIGGASFAALGPEALLGCAFAFLAAFGWGFEGCVAGFGTVLIDYRIGIAIRQLTAGALELLVAFPLLALIGSGPGTLLDLLGAALSDRSLLIFAISGLFAMPAFSFWYKGNSMCGTALGMACNGMYAFWGPLFIWLIMCVLGIGRMAEDYPPLSATQWAGALIMVAGIFCIAINPLEALKKKGSEKAAPAHASKPQGAREEAAKLDEHEHGKARRPEPLYYAIVRHFSNDVTDCADGVMKALAPDYRTYKLFTKKDVEEALATAKENGILDEVCFDISDCGDVRVFYRANDFGRDLMRRYIGA